MDTMVRRKYDSLVNILAFVLAHSAIFGATALGTKMVAALQAVVERLTELFVTDRSGHTAAHEKAVARRDGRAALRRAGKALHRAGQLLAADGLTAKDRFPEFRFASDRDLAADARLALQNALPLKDLLVKHGLPSTLLDELPVHIAAVDQAIADQATARETHVSAKVAARAGFEAAKPIVKTLETIFLSAPNVDPQIVAAWKNAKRIGPSRARSAAPVTPAPAPKSKTEVA